MASRKLIALSHWLSEAGWKTSYQFQHALLTITFSLLEFCFKLNVDFEIKKQMASTYFKLKATTNLKETAMAKNVEHWVDVRRFLFYAHEYKSWLQAGYFLVVVVCVHRALRHVFLIWTQTLRKHVWSYLVWVSSCLLVLIPGIKVCVCCRTCACVYRESG